MIFFVMGMTARLVLISTIAIVCLTSTTSGPEKTSLEILLVDEICDNGIDDNANGLIDLNDPDCDCLEIPPVSLVPNPSFEDMTCCPEGPGELNCSSSWIQASEATTDFIHTCGWLGWANFPLPMPIPEGRGVMGFRDGRGNAEEEQNRNWKEYAGACLTKPLVKDSTYRFAFDIGFVNQKHSPPMSVTIFGSTDCMYLPFGIGDINFGCPTNGPGWVRLGAVGVSSLIPSTWKNYTIEFTPTEDINAIAIGPPCRHHTSTEQLYYFFDNLILADERSFDFTIQTYDHPCSPSFNLSVPERPNQSYQWYKDGIALLGETDHELTQMYGEGRYEVLADNGLTCRLSNRFEFIIPEVKVRKSEIFCLNKIHQLGENILTAPGIYLDTFQNIIGCDSIVIFELKDATVISDTIDVKIYEHELFFIGNRTLSSPGQYNVELTGNNGCDSLVLVNLSIIQLFIPDIFSPNNDGINDVFTILGEADEFEVIEMQLFNRWGNQLFNGTTWNGMTSNKPAPEGVYVYTAKIALENNDVITIRGAVTLIR